MQKDKINTIFFDFGGTLDLDGVHWYRHWMQSWKSAGCEIPDERFKPAYFFAEATLNELVGLSCSYSELVATKCRLQALNLFGGKISDEEFEQAVKYISDITFEPIKRQSKLTQKLLSALAEKYRLGVISNFYGNLEQSLDELGFSKYLTYIIDSKRVNMRKPGTEIYAYSVNLTHGAAENCLMVGDSYAQDIVPAKSIGMATAMLDVPQLGLKEKINYDKIDYILSSINELTNIFFNRNGEKI